MRSAAPGIAAAAVCLAAPHAEPSHVNVGVERRQFIRQSPTWGQRTLLTTIWYPAATKERMPSEAVDGAAPVPKRVPVIVYSHGGCGGQPNAIAPLGMALARAGFVFVQFPHPGSTTNDCAQSGDRYVRALLERPDDIVHVIDGLRALDSDRRWRLHGTADASRVGIIGHSQGGQTALMMPARDRRVKGVLAISPSIAHSDTPPAVWQAVSHGTAPVIIIHGSQDSQWTSEGPRRAYDSLLARTPRVLLEVSGLGHTPNTPDQVALVGRYGSALFRWCLKGDRSAARSLTPSAAPEGVAVTSAGLP